VILTLHCVTYLVQIGIVVGSCKIHRWLVLLCIGDKHTVEEWAYVRVAAHD
jgi:hypothetical protein